MGYDIERNGLTPICIKCKHKIKNKIYKKKIKELKEMIKHGIEFRGN